MPKVFLSHTWKDSKISEKISDLLFQDNAELWVDYEKIKPGDSLPKKINDGIDWCEVFVLLWSDASSKSYWVNLEWECALTLRRLILPCLLDDTPLPPILRRLSYCDFRDFGRGYKRLFDALGLAPLKERAHLGESVKMEIEESRSNELKLECKPPAGGTGMMMTSIVSVKGNTKKIKVFSLDLSFNPSVLCFKHVEKGSLTKSWATVAGNERKPGSLVVGGYAGSGEPIADGSEGSIAVVRFRITCKDCRDGAKSRISIQNLTDDLEKMNLVSSLAEFNYEKKEINKERKLKHDREILQKMKQPLREFNQMNRFPDSYLAPRCMKLASYIETEAEKIQHPKFREIKEKLLEYARRKNKINQNTPLKTLMNLFQKRVEPDNYEPQVLCEEIEEVLKKSLVHSEDDL